MNLTTILRLRVLAAAGLVLWPVVAPRAAEPAVTNTFPSVPEVLGGRTFDSYTEQDIYFLRSIHDRYPDHWPDLLEANITLNDYVLSPEKLLRFVSELGEAMRNRSDPDAVTNLAQIVCEPAYFANTNVSHPEILCAAAVALIKIGPTGRRALASAFTEDHYRTDPASLEVLADAIGAERPDDPAFVTNLLAVAFKFSTTNGAFYPRCVTAAITNLLSLNDGPAAVRNHLKIEEVLGNPDVFQAVLAGFSAAPAAELATNLTVIQAGVESRLAALTNQPGGYRDDLQELSGQIGHVLTGAAETTGRPKQP